jgi:hypothetical protein
LDDKQEAFLIALACSTPPEERTCWTMQLLAGKLVELRVVDALTDETVQGNGVGIRDYGSMTIHNLFSSHGILQLALWATPVFKGAPGGYIYAPASSTSRRPTVHACPQRPELFDALASALLRYEYRYRYLYDALGYEMCCAKMQNAIATLDVLPTIPGAGHRPSMLANHAGLRSKKDQSATYVPTLVTPLQPRLHSRSTRLRLFLA